MNHLIRRSIHGQWKEYFIEQVNLIRRMSKDPSERVGAVIVNPLRIIVGTGFNGFPRGVVDYIERYDNKELKKRLIVHAEANAIVNSTTSLENCTMVISKFPCINCLGLMIQKGITKIMSPVPDENKKDESSLVIEIIREVGIQYEEIRIGL